MSVPPVRRLPERPSLEQLRKQAKEHLGTLRAADPSATLAAAQHVLAHPADDVTTDGVARQSGLSARTLERLFRAETGMSFGLWRQKARLLESVRLLVEGGSVTEAALESGYSSVSAYISAFKQTFGCTPGAMLTDMQWLVRDQS